jgi:hypothetical protein
MTERLVGRIAASQKDEPAEPLAARRACVGLEGRLVHTQAVEPAQAVLATASALRTATVAAPLVTRTVPADEVFDAVDTLGDLNPGLGDGRGRRLGLRGL